ncbi:MAG: hypothetical protein ACW99A_03005 [Candidatus Kariarchaeaceae archaeon]|jgi:hypothetical protein
MNDYEEFCGTCGAKNTGEKPAKSMDQPPSQPVSPSPPPQSPDPIYASQPPSTYQPPTQAPYYNVHMGLPQTRDFWVWLIIGFCTCGLGSIVYLYHNFNDVRKLENYKRYSNQSTYYGNQTSDPWVGLIAAFVCGVISWIMKYNTLNNYINAYGHPYQDPRPATAGHYVGSMIGIFFLFFIGLIILPLLLVAFAGLFYIIYLEKQWQDALNYQITNTWASVR